jgi:protein tyrosine phosphatase
MNVWYALIFVGPLEETQGDFWLMAWDYDCRSIVMLTNLVERKKVPVFWLPS